MKLLMKHSMKLAMIEVNHDETKPGETAVFDETFDETFVETGNGRSKSL